MKKILKVKLAFALSIILATANLNLVIPVFADNADSNVIVDYDFSKMTNPPTHTTGVKGTAGSTSTLGIVTDGSEQVLQWKRNIKAHAEQVNLEIPLATPITKADFPIEIEYSAKLDGLTSAPRGPFALKGTNSAGAVVNTLYGPTSQGSYVDYELRVMSEKGDKSKCYTFAEMVTDIFYDEKGLDSSKYYVHNFVINADGSYTYKIKEDKESAEWQDVYPDYTLWVTSMDWDYAAIKNNAGVLPDTITSLWSESTYFRGTGGNDLTQAQTEDMLKDKIDYFKYLKISKRRLKFEGTDLPEGENPEFSGKNIKLYFDSPISADTLYDGIKLYENDTEVSQDKYTLSVDADDASVVKLVLNNPPSVGSDYEIRINSELNKNKSGYLRTDDNYSVVLRFYNKQFVASAFLSYDFQTMTELPGYTSGALNPNTGTSVVSFATDSNEQVLQWKRNITQNGQAVMMELPLENQITADDFPIMVEYSAKLDRLTSTGRGHFGLKGVDASNNEVKSLYGPTKHQSYVDYAFRIISDKAGENFIGYADTAKTKILYNGSPLDSNKYYIHRFIINADGTYTYKIKEDKQGARWQDIHSDYTLWVLSKDYPLDVANAGVLPTTITSLYSEAGYFNGDGNNFTDAQKADMATDMIDYFKYIKVQSFPKKTKINNQLIMNLDNENAKCFGESVVLQKAPYMQNGLVMISAEIINDAFNTAYTADISTDELKSEGFSVSYYEQNGLILVGEEELGLNDEYIDTLALVNGVFVSVDGDENALGTKASPLSDFNAAVEKCALIKELTGFGPQIIAFGGDYYIPETIHINNSISGLKISPYNNEKVNIYGMQRIGEENITLAESSDCGGRLPENLIGKIIRIDLSQIPTEQLMPNESYNKDATDYVNYRDNAENEDIIELPYNCELFDNNKLQTIARWPDVGWAHMGEVTQHDGENATFITENPLNWDTNADDILIRNFRPYEYYCLQGDITGFDKQAHTANIYQSFHNFPILAGSRYYFFNIPEEITKKGEYYINYDEKAAYYYPENSGDFSDIAITTLIDGIIRIDDNSSDISIEGINFTGTRGSAIIGYNCRNIDVKNCNFSYTGDFGVYLGGCTECDLTQNTYDNIGTVSTAVRGGDIPSLTSGENTITESRFTNGGRIAKTYSPFISAKGVGTLVEHNYFYNHSQAAIIFEGNDNIIQKNIFDTCVTETVDAGAIYSGRKTTKWGNVIRNNIFKNINSFLENPKRNFAFAVYIDDTMPGTTIEDNLFYNCDSAINIGGGIATHIKGNLFYDCKWAGQYTYRIGTTQDWFNKEGGAYRWINEVRNSPSYSEEKWYSQYPDFKQLIEDIESEAVEELGEVIDEGTASSTPKTPIPERHKIKNAQIIDNLFVCEAVKDSANGGMDSIFGIDRYMRGFLRGEWQEYVDGQYKTYRISSSGKYENNYVNDDLSNVSINGKEITINNSIFTDGYCSTDGYNGYLNDDGVGDAITAEGITAFTAPDVSDAGPTISEIDLSVIPTANEGVYKTQAQRMDYSKYHAFCAESFDNYLSSDDITKMRSFNATKTTDGWFLSSSSVKFDGTGNVVIKGVSSYIAKLHLTPTKQFNSNVALYLKLTGNEATVEITDGTNTYTDNSAIGNIEYRVVDGVVTKYTLSEGKWIANATTGTLNGITKITITADKSETVKLDYVSLNKIGNNPEFSHYYDVDFEDTLAGQSAYGYNGISVYNAGTNMQQTIYQEDNGNKALNLLQKTSTETYDYTEISIDPIYTKDKLVTFEYSIKSLGEVGTINDIFELLGYNSDKPTLVVESGIKAKFGGYYDLNLYYNGTLIAEADEVKSDFIRIKVELDAKNSSYKVYRLTNGEWDLKTTVTNITIPEYIDKIQFWCQGPPAWEQPEGGVGDRSYLIDDIKIYDIRAIELITSADESIDAVNNYKGQSACLKPWYLPCSQIGTLIGAVYDEEGRLDNVTLKDYVPDAQIDVAIPDDNGKYHIKYFTWENVNTLKPIGETKQFN